MNIRTLAWIGGGGSLGALSRYYVGQYTSALVGAVFPNLSDTGFPVHTLLINLTGCLFLGFFLTLTSVYLRLDANIGLAIGTGFTGAFTTFSTFSVENITLLGQGKFLLMGGYILLSIGGGLLLAWCGVKGANYLGSRLAVKARG